MLFQSLSEYIKTNAPMTNIPELLNFDFPDGGV